MHSQAEPRNEKKALTKTVRNTTMRQDSGDTILNSRKSAKEKGAFFFFGTVPDGLFGGSTCGRYRKTAVAGIAGDNR